MARWLWLVIGMYLFSGCRKDEVSKAIFTVESTTSFTIPAGLNTVETHYFLVENIPSSLNAQLKSHNLTLDDLTKINPLQCRLIALDGSPTYQFIENISVRIYTKKNPTKREIAFMEPVPLNTGSNLQLFPTLIDVKDYLSSSVYSVEIRLRLRGFSSRTVDTRLDLAFEAR
ncbi:MAG: hypothetical protein KDC57_17095 [Saprospiraceae bacterium]|nr:hypothetical protein [Saprospiraceae bacterium]